MDADPRSQARQVHLGRLAHVPLRQCRDRARARLAPDRAFGAARLGLGSGRRSDAGRNRRAGDEDDDGGGRSFAHDAGRRAGSLAGGRAESLCPVRRGLAGAGQPGDHGEEQAAGFHQDHDPRTGRRAGPSGSRRLPAVHGAGPAVEPRRLGRLSGGARAAVCQRGRGGRLAGHPRG